MIEGAGLITINFHAIWGNDSIREVVRVPIDRLLVVQQM